MIVDLSEKPYQNILQTPKSTNDTLVIDNGVYELKAGCLNDLCIVVRNRIYKNKEKINFEPFPLSSMKTMFDGDVIIGFDVLEHSIDLAIEHIKPNKLQNLIFTTTPCSPTAVELIDFLFSVYKFNKIQIGYDFVYSYHKYFDKEDCLIIALKYSSVIVAYIANNKIQELYKINFGGKDLIDYINFIMLDKYKNFRKDYKNLTEHIRVSDDYNKEAVNIYNDMCNGKYTKNVFLSEPLTEKVEKMTKKPKTPVKNAISLPYIDYEVLAMDDSQLNNDQLREKKKHKMAYCGTLYRLKTRIEQCFQKFKDIVENLEDELQKQDNIKNYIMKKKQRFNRLKRDLELRDKLRQDSRNKKTPEFQIKNKEGFLDADEQRIKDMIADADDEYQESLLVKTIDEVANDILRLDPDFIPFYANTVEILRGDNIGRQCVNIELIKWPEIIFQPSIIGSEQMGLTEIIENISLKYTIKNTLICGGLSFIPNLQNRIESILTALSQNGPVFVVSGSSQSSEPFYNACFSPLCPIYTREEFIKFGAEKLAERN